MTTIRSKGEETARSTSAQCMHSLHCKTRNWNCPREWYTKSFRTHLETLSFPSHGRATFGQTKRLATLRWDATEAFSFLPIFAWSNMQLRMNPQVFDWEKIWEASEGWWANAKTTGAPVVLRWLGSSNDHASNPRMNGYMLHFGSMIQCQHVMLAENRSRSMKSSMSTWLVPAYIYNLQWSMKDLY